ncbi:hypothetical protein QR680_009264 [Steinernema hermaphroditum]|uniref:Junctophilin n=1 Tax=Steinernema hermaphroditum TaxID=289476 RepID=A0AA39M9K6_9BILA|nr:hypothetical protein QR680_009264 [Steinernema hermaphroditum]
MLLSNGNRLETKNGGRFDFDDGGVYVGEWEKGQAHGFAVATGPHHKGEYIGAWHYGFEVSGAYTWPSGNYFVGQWQNGRRHGLGTERRGRWIYRGEFNNGLRGRYGHRQSLSSRANYLGTWTDGLHDGYGTETYADGGFYSGSWSKGQRHGYGIRHSATHSTAEKYRPRSVTSASLTSVRSQYDHDVLDSKRHRHEEENEFAGRNGFVLKAFSGPQPRRRRSLSERSLAVKRGILSGFRIKKQHSTGDIHQRVTSAAGSLRSSGSTISCTSDDYEHHRERLAAPPEEVIGDDVFEVYKGEFKADERGGFGICERSDGLKYVGEWNRNKKNGYGVTYFKDGTLEEGKYRDNILVLSAKKKGILFVRPSAKIRERVEAAVIAAERAAGIAQAKADIAASRTHTAEERAESAVEVTVQAIADADNAFRACEIYMKPDEKGAQEILRRVGRACRLVRGQGEHAEPVPPFEHVLSGVASYRVAESHNQLDNPVYGNDLGLAHQEPGPSRSISHQNSQDSQNLLDHPASRGPVTFPLDEEQAYSQAAYLQAYGHPQHVQYSQQTAQLSVPNHIPHHAEVTYPAMPGPSRYDYAPPAQNLSEPARLDFAQPGPSQPPPVPEEDAESEAAEAAEELPAPRRFPNCVEHVGASRMSVNDDHFDQYMVTAHGTSRVLRRNRPSLTRQPEVGLLDSQNLNRRCTLASARDRQRDDFGVELEHRDADRGSLPNLHDLGHSVLHITREDASRLASQRRQEKQRLAEEEELLRSNPLRYLFHPSFLDALLQWRTFILLVAVNVVLLVVFFHLLFQRTPSAPRP